MQFKSCYCSIEIRLNTFSWFTLPVFDPLSPLKVVSSLASPVEMKMSFANPTFGKQASIDVTVEAVLRGTDQLVPMAIAVDVDGERSYSEFTSGRLSRQVTFKTSGMHKVETYPSDSERFSQQFGPFIPYGSDTLQVIAVKPEAIIQCSNEMLAVPVDVNEQSFRAGDIVLFSLLESDVGVITEFPETHQGLYALEPRRAERRINSDAVVRMPYNAPRDLDLSVSLSKECITVGETITATLNVFVKDVCGLGFPVALLVQSKRYQTDSSGRISIPFQITSAGRYDFDVVTDTPISIRKALTIYIPQCLVAIPCSVSVAADIGYSGISECVGTQMVAVPLTRTGWNTGTAWLKPNTKYIVGFGGPCEVVFRTRDSGTVSVIQTVVSGGACQGGDERVEGSGVAASTGKIDTGSCNINI